MLKGVSKMISVVRIWVIKYFTGISLNYYCLLFLSLMLLISVVLMFLGVRKLVIKVPKLIFAVPIYSD